MPASMRLRRPPPSPTCPPDDLTCPTQPLETISQPSCVFSRLHPPTLLTAPPLNASSHVRSLQYLLLGKGDFVQQLMEHLAPQLVKRATDLHRHQLLSLVESAVRSSASSDDAEVTLLLEHLDVKVCASTDATSCRLCECVRADLSLLQ